MSYINKFHLLLLALLSITLFESRANSISTLFEQDLDASSHPRVVYVDQLATDAEVHLVVDEARKETLTLKASRNVGVLFYLPPSHAKRKISLKLERQHSSPLPITARWNVEQVDRNTNSQKHTEQYWLTLKLAMESAEGLKKSLVLQNTLLNSQGLKDPLRTFVQKSYLNGLLETESYQEVFDYVKAQDNAFDVSVMEANGNSVFFAWALATAYAQQEQYEQAALYYSSMVQHLEKNVERSSWQDLVHVNARVGLATSLVLQGLQLGEASLLASGKDMLLNAKSRASELGDGLLMSQIENALAPYYFATGDFVKAEEALLNSIQISRDIEFENGAAAALNNLSVLYRRQGRLHDSLASIKNALHLKRNDDYSSERANYSLNLATVYSELGKHNLASISAGRASEEYSNVGNDYAAAQACLVQGKAYRYGRRFEESTKTNRKCLSSLLDVLDLSDDNHKEANRDLAQAYLQIALDEYDSGDFKKSQILANQSKHYMFGSSGLAAHEYFLTSALELDVILLLSSLSLASKDHREFNKYLPSLEAFFSSKLAQDKFLRQKLSLLKLKVSYFHALGDFLSVDGVIDSMFELGEQLGSKLDGLYLGPAWSAEFAASFDEHIARTIYRAEVDQNPELYDSVFQVLERLSGASLHTSRLEGALVAMPNRGIVQTERNAWSAATVRDKKAQTDSLLKVMENRSALLEPSRLPINFLGRTVLSTKEVQDQLEEGELALKVYQSDDVVLIYLISNQRIKVIKKDGSERQSELLKDAISLITKRSSKFGQSGLTVEAMFGEDKDLILEATKVIFTANNDVSSFPLGSLNIASSGERYMPLSSQAEVVLTYSLSEYFSKVDEGSKAFTNDFAVFADPVFNTESIDKESAEDSELRSWSATLRRLPWSAKEASHIKNLFNVKRTEIYTGNEATSERLLSKGLRNSRVLHIATHGYFSSETPDVVGIATSPIDEDSPGFTTLSRLFSKSYDSNLIVISGCETSLGDDLGVEGAHSLSRAFIARGAGSVIGTLWRVPDRPTAEFMKLFYNELKKQNGNASRALVMAKRSFWESGQFRHPYFWAGFNLTSVNRVYDTNSFR